MKRLYLPNINIENDLISLNDNYFINYIKNVLRYNINEEIVILSNNFNYNTKIVEINKKRVVFSILSKEIIKRRDSEIILVQSIFKWERFEWLLEKVVELGVDKIIPVITMRTTTKYNNWEKKVKRFEKIIYKALTQSQQNIVPEISEPIKLSKLITDTEFTNLDSEKIFFDTKNDIPTFSQDIIKNEKNIIFIGPEGGIDNNERELLKNNGFKQYRLNLPILRAETAAIISVAQINMRLNR